MKLQVVKASENSDCSPIFPPGLEASIPRNLEARKVELETHPSPLPADIDLQRCLEHVLNYPCLFYWSGRSDKDRSDPHPLQESFLSLLAAQRKRFPSEQPNVYV